MFISDEEFVARITSEDNLVNRRRVSPAPAPDLDLPLPGPIELDLPSLLDTPPLDSNLPKSTRGERKQSLPKNLDPLDLPNYAGSGTKSFHRDVQAGIGVTSAVLGPTKASRMNDVAISSSHSYARGYTGPVDLVDRTKSPKEDLLNKVVEGHGIIVDKCFNRLLKTLDLMDDEKLEKIQNPLQLSIIAKNVSGIIAHAANSTKENVLDAREQQVHFHIMKPEMGTEKEYPTIEVSSAPSDPNALPE